MAEFEPRQVSSLASMSHVKLVRWHPRPPEGFGAEFVPLLKHCKCLTFVDLSSFYHWTEDLTPVLKAYPEKSAILTCLNLLMTSFFEGYRSQEIIEITAARPNLNKWLVCLIRGASVLSATKLYELYQQTVLG